MLGIARDPIDLLHPLLYNDENLEYARQAYAEMELELKPQQSALQFEKDNIERIEEHKWLKSCETILYTQSLDNLLLELRKHSKSAPDYINKDERNIIALDLETTGLHKGVKLIQGKIQHYNHIVGICLAVSDTKGYYLPVNHNGLDGIPNYDYNDIITFLQALVDEFHIIYHNAVFDQEVMALNGVRFANSSFSDTLLLGFLMGWKQDYKTLGLKFLAKTILNRPMLEINEIMGSKKEIRLQTIPAKNAYVYGCSDAMNTYGLFKYIAKDKETPYKTQTFKLKLLHNSVATTRSMFRVGLPVGYDTALKTTRTVLRRMIMLENIYLAKISDDSVAIGSAEQLGIYLYATLKREYEAKYSPERPLIKGDKQFDLFCKAIKQEFKMEVKFREMKNGTEKIVCNSDADTLKALYNNLHKWDFIDPNTADEIYILCEIVDEYRSLANKAKIFVALVRNCFNDDLNLCRTPINLKLVGTDTGRFSNGGSKNGAWDRIRIKHNKTSSVVSYVEGQGMNEFNAQGLSHESGHWKQLKKVKNFKQLNPKFKEVSNKLDRLVEARLYEILTTDKDEK